MSDASSLDITIQQAKQGQPGALERLLAQYRPYLKLVASQGFDHTRVLRRVDASDVVQSALLKAVRSFDGFQGTTEAEFSAWLHRIVRNTLINEFRSARADVRDIARERPLEAIAESASIQWHEPAARGTSPSQQVLSGERALRLAAALELLEPNERHAVRLRYLVGLKCREVADALGVPLGTAAGYVRRGLGRLRELLGEESGRF